MNKIEFKKLKKLTSMCGFNISIDGMDGRKMIGVHHCHEWDHGYCSGSSRINNDGTFEEIIYDIRRNFYSDLRDMQNFLIQYMEYNGIKEFILAPLHRYHPLTFSGKPNEEIKDIYFELDNFLKKYDIKKNSRSGINLNLKNNYGVLEMVLESAFRGISNLCVFLPEKSVILDFDPHFDIIFFSIDFGKEKNIITNLLKNHINLRYYERTYE